MVFTKMLCNRGKAPSLNFQASSESLCLTVRFGHSRCEIFGQLFLLKNVLMLFHSRVFKTKLQICMKDFMHWSDIHKIGFDDSVPSSAMVSQLLNVRNIFYSYDHVSFFGECWSLLFMETSRVTNRVHLYKIR